jgi:hypothetical protein
MAEIARYRLILPHFIDDDLIEVGEIIEYAGTPSENMEPMNEPAREALIAYIGTLQDGKRTPDLGDIIYKQMANRPKEAGPITDPELIAAVEAIRLLKSVKVNDEGPKSFKLPEKRDDVPMTGNDPGTRRGKPKTVKNLGPAPDDMSQPVRKLTGNLSHA